MKIEDYGFIGDTETAALVGRNGSIDWFCTPRFDSPSCFSALLGDKRNGRWLMAPAEDPLATRRRYRDGTLILETEFATEHGLVRLVDFMPPRGTYPSIIRIVEGIRGEVTMRMELIIRFDYGSTIPWVRRASGGLTCIGGPDALIFRTEVPTHGKDLTTVAEFTVRQGARVPFVLAWYPSHEEAPKSPNAMNALKETEKYWSDWVGQCEYEGEWREAVVGSLVTLKGLTHARTGGIVAAATTSLPEKFGGARNWDYRFCWLRDATFTLYALVGAGYLEEAAAWRDWLLRAIAGSPDQMQIMYGVAGERRLTEFKIPWLPGYEDSTPVRIGNAATEQFQLDVYGEVMDCLYQARRAGLEPDPAAWRVARGFVKYLEKHWSEPDDGIWEVRGGRRHFTHSKMMAWVAMDRAVKAMETYHLAGNLQNWKEVRDKIHADVCHSGYNAQRKAFMQYYGGDGLDASLLMMPLVGFLPITDPRVRNTIEAIERELVIDGFVYRYHPEKSEHVDGLEPGEGVFLPCTFWLADCLNLSGRHDDAMEIFERLLGVRNDLGLLAEEYDPHQRRLAGNFPQAFSHVGLINTAANLSHDSGPAMKRCGRANGEKSAVASMRD